MNTIYYHRKKFLFIPLILDAIALFAYITMALWNALLPDIFRLTMINFWQAAGLIALARLFFGFGHSGKWGGHSPYMSCDVRNKIKNMSADEKKESFMKMQYDHGMWYHGCYGKKEPATDGKSGE